MSGGSRRTAAVIALALAGIVLAAGLAVLTSNLTGQHIGLSSAPLAAGQRLVAPLDARVMTTARPKAKRRIVVHIHTVTVTVAAPAAVAPAVPAPTPAPAATPTYKTTLGPKPKSPTKTTSRSDDGKTRSGDD